MYRINNENDIPYILNYHRARDMVNIMTFFPRLSPIDDLAIILNEEDYTSNLESLSNLTSIRNGNPVKEPCMKSIPVKEINSNKLDILKEIKKENKEGVLILFHLNVEPTERYERYAGISVGVSLGRKIYIDAVGKGFDGREVLKGIGNKTKTYFWINAFIREFIGTLYSEKKKHIIVFTIILIAIMIMIGVTYFANNL